MHIVEIEFISIHNKTVEARNVKVICIIMFILKCFVSK